MSKKKNTLKDLDEFLKQQAATLVSPSRIKEQQPVENREEEQSTSVVNVPVEQSVSRSSIERALLTLQEQKGSDFKNELYTIVLHTLEKQREFSPEDKMLVNTLLYLKHGPSWKEAIRDFWRNQNL